MSERINAILKRYDDGETDPRALAAAQGVSFSYVYGILREHRPDRKRKPRERTSEKRKLILALLAKGIRPTRVAFLAQCTLTYVYFLMKEEGIAADSICGRSGRQMVG